jgi:hypothetical protein
MGRPGRAGSIRWRLVIRARRSDGHSARLADPPHVPRAILRRGLSRLSHGPARRIPALDRLRNGGRDPGTGDSQYRRLSGAAVHVALWLRRRPPSTPPPTDRPRAQSSSVSPGLTHLPPTERSAGVRSGARARCCPSRPPGRLPFRPCQGVDGRYRSSRMASPACPGRWCSPAARCRRGWRGAAHRQGGARAVSRPPPPRPRLPA